MTTGQRTYEAYAQAVGGTAFNDEPLPTWDELEDRQKLGWAHAEASAVLAEKNDYGLAPDYAPAMLQSNQDFTVYGILPPDQVERFKQEYAEVLRRMNPMVETIYDRMTSDQQAAIRQQNGGNMVWATYGGLRYVSGSTVVDELHKVRERWHDTAQLWATNARRNATPKWSTGPRNDWLIDPEGRTSPRGGNGQTYSRYTMPSSAGVPDMGDFDGTITDETKFTT